MVDNHRMNLGEAANSYLAKLPPDEREMSQTEVLRFVRWFGREHSLDGLTAAEVANYAERLSLSDTDYAKKLELVKVFLAYAKNEHWSKTNLAVHLKPKKGKTKPAGGASLQPEVVPLTEEGYAKLQAELVGLKQRRPQAIEEITRAAADKDFRENAPLEAAREQHGLIEGRIREVEATLKAAAIVDKKRNSALKVSVGDSIVLVDLESGEEMPYMIVGPRETDPSQGKISGVSPVGKAVVGRREGEVVEVAVPVGKMRYQIKQIKR